MADGRPSPDRESMDFYFGEHWRMDWGFGNPNKTAALIATLMIAVWQPAWRDARSDSRRPWFWVSLTLFLALGVCLIHTYSRGGLLAAVVGLGTALCFLPRPWHRSIVIPITVSVTLLAAYAFLGPSEAGQRYVQGVGTSSTEDRSITNRLEIWKRAPAMMVDAPGGWGIGQSGFAYTQYYQPTETRYTYRTLVNSHLTWLVELGGWGRFVYLTGWLFLLALTWPPGLSSPLPFAAWLALGVAGFFSSVLEAWLLFAVPGLLLLVAISSLRKSGNGSARCRIASLVAIPTALLMGLGFWIMGMNFGRGSLLLHHSEGITSLQKKASPATTFLLLQPDLRVVGNHFGIAIREHLQSESNSSERWMVGLEPGGALPASDAVILSGTLEPASLPEASASTSRWIFLNPAITDLGNLSERIGHADTQSFILGGRLRDRSTIRLKQAIQSSNHHLTEIGGARTYLPSWIEAVTTTHPRTTP